MLPLKNVLKNAILHNNAKYYSVLTRSMAAKTTVNTKDLIVQHDEPGNKFYIQLTNGSSAIATLEYEKLANILNFHETTVPEQFQGQGIGKILAKVRT